MPKSQPEKLTLSLEAIPARFKSLHSFLVDRLGEEDFEAGGYTAADRRFFTKLEAEVAKLVGETPVYEGGLR
jgi:hypothetical protein